MRQQTFQTKSEGIQDVGVGNRTLVEPVKSNTGDLISATASFAADSVKGYAAVESERIADEIVKDATSSLEDTRKAAEDFGQDEPVVLDIKTSSDKAAKGVKQGKITRENARLLVSNQVVKAIEEQPWLSRQIRQAATNLLGFDPKSEATKQFFSSFETEREAAAKAAAAKPTEYEKTVNNLLSTGLYSPQEASRMAGRTIKLQAELDLMDAEVKAGNISADQQFTKLNTDDNMVFIASVGANMKAAADSGEPFSPALWKNNIREYQTASWLAVQTKLMSQPVPPTAETISKFKEEHDKKYDDFYDRVKDYGPEVVNKEWIAREQLSNEVQAYVSTPQLQFIKDAYGERNLGAVMDLIVSAGGDAGKQQALLAMNPGLKGFVDMLNLNRGRATGELLSVMNMDRASMNPEQATLLDAFITPAMSNAEPEDREKHVENLFKNDFKQRALGIVFSKPRSSATEKEVKTVKKIWDETKANVIPQVFNGLSEFTEDATKGGVTFETVKDSKTGIDMLVAYQGRNLTGGKRQLTSGPIAKQLVAINKFLVKGGEGWGQDLEMGHPSVVAKQWLTTLEELALLKELKSKE